MPVIPERSALRARYSDRRAQVVLDAARIFARRGYDQTSVPQLAKEVGIATGGLYHYFRGKEEILIAICDQLMSPLLDDLNALLSEEAPATVQLRAAVGLWIAHVIAHRDHMLVFQQERHMIDHGDQWRGVRDDRKRFERLLESVLVRVHDEEMARLAEPRLSLTALLGMVNHLPQWYRPDGRLTADEMANGYTALIVDQSGGS